MKEYINVWIKEPGLSPRHAKIKNDLKELQQIVGGYIEVVTMQNDAGTRFILIINEEGKINGLDPNFWMYGDLVVGPAIFAGENHEEFDDCPIETEKELLMMLKEVGR